MSIVRDTIAKAIKDLEQQHRNAEEECSRRIAERDKETTRLTQNILRAKAECSALRTKLDALRQEAQVLGVENT